LRVFQQTISHLLQVVQAVLVALLMGLVMLHHRMHTEIAVTLQALDLDQAAQVETADTEALLVTALLTQQFLETLGKQGLRQAEAEEEVAVQALSTLTDGMATRHLLVAVVVVEQVEELLFMLNKEKDK
jgi:hypothetical protein